MHPICVRSGRRHAPAYQMPGDPSCRCSEALRRILAASCGHTGNAQVLGLLQTHVLWTRIFISNNPLLLFCVKPDQCNPCTCLTHFETSFLDSCLHWAHIFIPIRHFVGTHFTSSGLWQAVIDHNLPPFIFQTLWIWSLGIIPFNLSLSVYLLHAQS